MNMRFYLTHRDEKIGPSGHNCGRKSYVQYMTVERRRGVASNSDLLRSVREQVPDPCTQRRTKAQVTQFSDQFEGDDGIKSITEVHK